MVHISLEIVVRGEEMLGEMDPWDDLGDIPNIKVKSKKTEHPQLSGSLPLFYPGDDNEFFFQSR